MADNKKYIEVGKALESARLAKEMSRQDVANAINEKSEKVIGQKAYEHYEKGRRPPYNTALLLQEILELPQVMELYDYVPHGTISSTPTQGDQMRHDKAVGKVTDADYVTIPTYTIGAQAGPDEQHVTDVGEQSVVRLPKDLFADAEAVLDVYGNSMLPGYPAGAKLAIARIYDKDFFEWGEVYVIKLKNRPRPMFKRVYESDRPDCILLVSDNTMLNNSGPLIGKLAYPEQHLKLSMVDEVWEVIGDQKRRKNKSIMLRDLREKATYD